jgi:adenine deaminase
MREELRDGPAEVFLQVPPCVPATPNATTGGTIEASDVGPLLEEPGSLGVAEA